MDVRCEKCLTVYELDDAKVGEGGLTVKCQECGNLFKVRRRPDTAELAAQTVDGDPTSETAMPPEGVTDRELALSKPLSSALPPSDDTMAASVRAKSVERLVSRGPDSVEERGWMLRRAANGEVTRFRELTTLQQWIVERKVTRQDEISRGGESWKTLGGIAELASFFHIVEQAQAVADASQPGLAVQRSRRGDSIVAELPTDLLRALPAQGPTSFGAGAYGGDATIVDDEVLTSESPAQSHGVRNALVVFTLAAIIAVTVGGLLLWRRAGEARHDAAGSSAEAVADLAKRGRAAFMLDTDDGFRQAISLLERAGELDPTAILVRVDLGEAHLTWAAYLLDDAHALEASGGAAGAQAARSLRTEAQAHLERARRALEELMGAEATASPALARAFGDLLRVEGAPAAAVERHLHRAAQKGTDDAELAYALGELARREGKNDEATTRLADATRLGHTSGGLARAQYRMAQLAFAAGRTDEAARDCDALFRISPLHERGHTLCAAPALDAGVTVRADAGTELAPTGETASSGKPPVLAPPGSKDALPADYKTLVRDADRMSENGHSPQARKLYERALELDPKGVAAYTGLGYCDLDAERFMQAVDRFNAALAIDPDSGDAMLGLAESYKIRGQSARAIEFYKKYIAAHPSGPKVQMAQKNVLELEPRAAKESADMQKADHVAEKLQEKAVEQAIEKGHEKKSGDDKAKDPVLPRPPAEETTP